VKGDAGSSLVLSRSGEGADFEGRLVRLTRNQAVFELCNPSIVLRTSEVLPEFSIASGGRKLYSGRAVVRGVVHTGVAVVCDVTLSSEYWSDVDLGTALSRPPHLRDEYRAFLKGWERTARVLPEFKLVMGDLQSFFSELRLWLEQIELGIRSSPSSGSDELERKVIDELAGPVVRSIDVFVDRFEELAERLDPEVVPFHQSYLRRSLHPWLLSSPFAYRAYHKPLGYAGDYEIVDMMLRPPYEGSTLFAKVLNVWLLGQAPATAHRNRVDYLSRTLMQENLRLQRQGRGLRVFNMGCGPAAEVQRFLQSCAGSDQTAFTLVDFNEETLQYVRRWVSALKNDTGRIGTVSLVRKSVQTVLKEAVRSGRSPQEQYDFVYCAGLFDYLPDPTCRRLMDVFYDMLAPEGLLLVTNVSDVMNRARPFRYSMEYMLDWYLTYRDGHALASLAPARAPREQVRVIAEETGVNVFLEVRKPSHA